LVNKNISNGTFVNSEIGQKWSKYPNNSSGFIVTIFESVFGKRFRNRLQGSYPYRLQQFHLLYRAPEEQDLGARREENEQIIQQLFLGHELRTDRRRRRGGRR